ncbi:ATP synthase complex subunit H-domain-containing protein [Xylaria cubensis]|nr:ATP synthase complex subunit H-domain-containing protein [Xylaria cubensis]
MSINVVQALAHWMDLIGLSLDAASIRLRRKINANLPPPNIVITIPTHLPIGPSSSSRQYVDTIESLNMDFLTFSQTARSALSAVTRVARVSAVRGFIAPTVSRRADFVQELYLKELKAYKPTPIKETDSVGQVQTFSAPKTPKSPEEADLANSLKEYENMAVEVEGNEGATASSTPAVVEDWLVEEEEEEKGGAHH